MSGGKLLDLIDGNLLLSYLQRVQLKRKLNNFNSDVHTLTETMSLMDVVVWFQKLTMQKSTIYICHITWRDVTDAFSKE